MACEDVPTSGEIQTLKLDAATINEVVTSSNHDTPLASDGLTKRTLAGIEQDADSLLIGIQADADAAIGAIGGTAVGNYNTDPTLTTLNEYTNDGTSNYKAKSSTVLPYTIDSTTYPNAADDPNIVVFADINSGNIQQYTSPRRNHMVNGNCDIWQRSVSIVDQTTSNEYGSIDRWRSRRAGNATGMTVSRDSSVSLPGSQYSMNVYRVNGDSNLDRLALLYTAESADAIKLQGKTVTLSFWAFVGSSFSAPSVSLRFSTGTGIDESANMLDGRFTTGNNSVVDSAAIDVSQKGVLQKVEVSYVVPSNATQFSVSLVWTPVGITSDLEDGIRFFQFKLEDGESSSEFSTMGTSIAEELAICQRYYIKKVGNYFHTRLYAGSIESLQRPITESFPVKMRSIPAITLEEIAYSNISNVAPFSPSEDGFNVEMDWDAVGVYTFVANYEADAEL